jgi:AsmA protein
LGLVGSASIADRDLDLKGTAALLAATSGNTGSPFELPFVVHGSWDNPDIRPDPGFLIRRSPATAPFFPKISDENLKQLDSIAKRWAPATNSPSEAATPPASLPLGQAEAQPPGN